MVASKHMHLNSLRNRNLETLTEIRMHALKVVGSAMFFVGVEFAIEGLDKIIMLWEAVQSLLFLFNEYKIRSKLPRLIIIKILILGRKILSEELW